MTMVVMVVVVMMVVARGGGDTERPADKDANPPIFIHTSRPLTSTTTTQAFGLTWRVSPIHGSGSGRPTCERSTRVSPR